MNARELLERIQRDAGLTDPEQILLVSRIINRAAFLQGRSMAGEDVAAELKHVEAQAANLDQHVRGVVQNVYLSWTQELLARALGVAIAGA